MLDLENIFGFHKGTEITGPMHDSVRETLKSTAKKLSELTPKCAEQTIAIRKLQESMFYFNAAIALNSPMKSE
jgi:hypothetical protein